MTTWREAVIKGIRRLTNKKNSYFFSRQEIIQMELHQIENEVGAQGVTPSQTLSRVLQELRDDNIIEFSDNQGNYIFLADGVIIENEDFTEVAIDAAINSKKLVFSDITTGETVRQSRQRIGQNRLRHWTLINYQNQCALCDVSDQNLLVAAHLARWTDCPEGRGDLRNIVCLCRWHDPLVEFGLISFSDNYEILKKPHQSKMLGVILQNTKHYRKPINMAPCSEFLELHRKRSGFSN